MPATQEITVSATEFKAKCLELMKQVSSGKLRRVHVTNRGKPLVAVTPESSEIVDEKPWSAESIFGCMKGEVGLADIDWEKPAYTDAELDDFLQDTLDQIDEFARRPRD